MKISRKSKIQNPTQAKQKFQNLLLFKGLRSALIVLRFCDLYFLMNRLKRDVVVGDQWLNRFTWFGPMDSLQVGKSSICEIKLHYSGNLTQDLRLSREI